MKTITSHNTEPESGDVPADSLKSDREMFSASDCKE